VTPFVSDYVDELSSTEEARRPGRCTLANMILIGGLIGSGNRLAALFRDVAATDVSALRSMARTVPPNQRGTVTPP